jgi:hypothetical protein
MLQSNRPILVGRTRNRQRYIPPTVGSGFLSPPASGRGAIREAWAVDKIGLWDRTGVRPLAKCEPASVCRLVSGLDRPAVSGHFLLALSKSAVEQVQHVSEALARELGVVAKALVAAERVLAVHLHPREAGSGVFERGVDGLATLTRDVRILAAPDHRQLAANSPTRSSESSFIPWPRLRLWISVA